MAAVCTVWKNATEPIRALWAVLRMGTLCSCISARKITKDVGTKMPASVEEIDVAAQVVVSELNSENNS